MEWVTLLSFLSIFLCSVGVVLVAQPKFFDLPPKYTEQDKSHTMCNISRNSSVQFGEEYRLIEGNTSEMGILEKNVEFVDDCYTKGVIFACLAGLAYALFLLIQKKYLQEIPSHLLIFYACLIGSIPTWIIAFCVEDITLPHSQNKILLFLGHCLTAMAALNVYAQKYTSVSLLSASKASFIVFMFIGQYTVMKNIFPGHRNWIEILGACILTIGSALVPLTALGEVAFNEIKTRFANKDGREKLISDD